MGERRCRELVAKRAQNCCERCGSSWNLSYHHRKKRSAGGKWECENVVLVCGSGTTKCHGFIEHNPNDSETEGYHVRPWQNPADIPVLILGTWYLLLPDGEVKEHAQ